MTLLAAGFGAVLSLGQGDVGSDRPYAIPSTSSAIRRVIPVLPVKEKVLPATAAAPSRFVPMPLPTTWNIVAIPIPTTWDAKVMPAVITVP